MTTAFGDRTKIVWIGVDGTAWHLAGRGVGREGVILASDPEGLFQPPHELLIDEGARQDGATFRRAVVSKRELDFNISIGNRVGLPMRDMRHWQQVHDRWWRGWSRKKPGHLCVWTKSKGWRKTQLYLDMAPKALSGMDPSINLHEAYTISASGMDPFYASLEREVSWTNSAGTNQGILRMRNDASEEAWPRYTLKGPGRWFIEDRDPAADPEGDLRMMTLPPILAGETLRIDLHPRNRTARLFNAGGIYVRNVWGQMGGRRFLHALVPNATTEIHVQIQDGDLTSEAVGTLTPKNGTPL